MFAILFEKCMNYHDEKVQNLLFVRNISKYQDIFVFRDILDVAGKIIQRVTIVSFFK